MSGRSYVNNSMNRSLGRVGMAVGSAPVSRGSTGSSVSSGYSSGTYVDNSSNRAHGRVGLGYGTPSASSTSSGASSQSPKTYVDNAYNQAHGRVGLQYGTATISSSSSGVSSQSPKTYVDNAYNRAHGRVGLEHGTAPVSQSSTSSSSASSPKTYVDNSQNRSLGRVGLPHGTAVSSTSSEVSSSPRRAYVDNALNRKLGRVGLPLGSMPVKSCSTSEKSYYGAIQDHFYGQKPDMDFVLKDMVSKKKSAIELNNNDYAEMCERAIGIAYRHKVVMSKKEHSTTLPAEYTLNYSDIKREEKIGGGGFGDVYAATWRGGLRVAVKILRVQRVSQFKKKQFEDEVKILATLKHPAIVQFYGACVESPKLAIVMEFMRAGSMYDVLHIECIQLTDSAKNKMTADVLSALKYIHDKNIAHRDIKSRNVMICDNMSNCKLVDFGCALKEDTDSSASVQTFAAAGTIVYSPPEVLSGEMLTVEQLLQADVYSVALTIAELLTEKEPFQGYNQHQVRKAVFDGERPNLQGSASEKVQLLLGDALSGNAKRRPSASQFLKRFSESVAV